MTVARTSLATMAAVVVGLLPAVVSAGRYPAGGVQSFTGAGPITDLGDGTVIASSATGSDGYPAAVVLDDALRLTEDGTGNTLSSFKLPDLDPGEAVAAWDATLQVSMDWGGSWVPADGWSLNVGPIPGGNGTGEGGFVMAGGLVIAFDTYNNGSDVPSIEVIANGIPVGNFPQSFVFTSGVFRDLVIHWDGAGLDLTYTVDSTPVTICTNLPTPGYLPVAGHRFAFSARTGGATQGTYLDNLLIETEPEVPVETGGPVISEFSADNAEVIEDENGDSSDWIEIYNGSAAAVDLGGWTLTDSAAVPGMWVFPAVTIPAYGHLVVFASGKDRRDPAWPLHTSFALAKEAGYLALAAPGGAIASQFDYGVQAEDVSYGMLGDGGSVSWGYLETPTPGRANCGLQAAGPPAEEVVFLRDGQPAPGGLFAGAFDLAIQPPAATGSSVRYTLDNTPPTTASALYSGAIPVAATTTVRARVYTPDRLPGPVSSRTFLQLGASLTNYHSSGRPFSSSLPIIVLDSFGVPVDAYSDPGQARPYRLTYAVVIDGDPLAAAPDTGRAVITGPADFRGRGGTHVRGESSAGFPQRSYAWELWNNEDEDKDAALLGFPAESDWVLYAPYNDKTLMRNFLACDRARAHAGNAAGMGVRFVEVFFNQDGGALAEGDYRGVYVLVEKIKRDADRVDVEKLNPLMTDPALISGGYVFKKDKAGIDNISFTTATNGQWFQFVEPEAPNAAQRTWLANHLNSFEAALAGSGFANPATGYAAYIDPASFVDNQWLVEITKQIDGYRLSTYFHKGRTGRIRALPVWDYNLSLFNADYNGGDAATGWYHATLNSADYYYWPRLHQDPNYRLLHWDRYWVLRRGLFATDAILNYIDGLAGQLVDGSTTPVTNGMANQSPLAENPAMRHFRKWPILGTYVWPNPANYANRTKFWNGATLDPDPYTSADGEVDAMKDFLRQRLAWIDDQNYVGNTIYRPPVFSHQGGSVEAGTVLAITRHTGTAPPGYVYASGGIIYYTTDGSDPRAANGAAVGSVYSAPLVLDHPVTVKARLFTNGNWSPLTAADFIVGAAPAGPASLVISEISYKPVPPAPGTAEYLAGFTEGKDFEYVELLNVGGGYIDLSGCRFSTGITFDFAGTDPAMLTLAPGERALVVANRDAFLLRFGSGLAGQVLGAFGGSLSNEGETVTLLAADGGVIASVSYGIAEPWPVAAQDAGYSLVLNNPAPSPAYAAADFRASAEPGGTPGAAAGPAFTGDPLADGDRDGACDLLEYATGSLPDDAGSRFLPVAGTVSVGADDFLAYSYRRANAADGVDCIVEYSTDLADWSSAPGAVAYVGTTNNGDGTSTVTWRATAPAGAAARQFMRLRVTRR